MGGRRAEGMIPLARSGVKSLWRQTRCSRAQTRDGAPDANAGLNSRAPKRERAARELVSIAARRSPGHSRLRFRPRDGVRPTIPLPSRRVFLSGGWGSMALRRSSRTPSSDPAPGRVRCQKHVRLNACGDVAMNPRENDVPLIAAVQAGVHTQKFKQKIKTANSDKRTRSPQLTNPTKLEAWSTNRRQPTWGGVARQIRVGIHG